MKAATRSDPADDAARPEGRADGRDPQPNAREFARLFTAEAPRVWRLLRRLGVREADLEDVCQEVFIVVHRRWAEFRGDSTLPTWIYGIALRKAAAHRRAAHVRKVTALAPGEEPAVAPEQQHSAELAQGRQLLQRWLDALPPELREVLVLYELEQLPMREVAQALELPLQTAYSRLYAARERIAAECKRGERTGGST